MSQEIERKFLVADDSYRRLAYKKSRIEQGYICRLNKAISVAREGKRYAYAYGTTKAISPLKDLPTHRVPAVTNGSRKFPWAMPKN